MHTVKLENNTSEYIWRNNNIAQQQNQTFDPQANSGLEDVLAKYIEKNELRSKTQEVSIKKSRSSSKSICKHVIRENSKYPSK